MEESSLNLGTLPLTNTNSQQKKTATNWKEEIVKENYFLQQSCFIWLIFVLWWVFVWFGFLGRSNFFETNQDTVIYYLLLLIYPSDQLQAIRDTLKWLKVLYCSCMNKEKSSEQILKKRALWKLQILKKTKTWKMPYTA